MTSLTVWIKLLGTAYWRLEAIFFLLFKRDSYTHHKAASFFTIAKSLSEIALFLLIFLITN